MRSLFRLIVSFLICFAVAFIGSKLTATTVETWYPSLVQPIPPPPNWVFSVVWSCLYTLMAISLWIVWSRDGGSMAYWIFAVQLALNLFWTVLFFALHLLWFAAIEGLVLWLAVGAMMVIFYRVSKVAGLLQLPYFLWTGYATVVTFSVALAN